MKPYSKASSKKQGAVNRNLSVWQRLFLFILDIFKNTVNIIYMSVSKPDM